MTVPGTVPPAGTQAAGGPGGQLAPMLAGLRALGPVRLGAMAAVAAAVMGMLAFFAMRGGTAPMGLLYADLDLRDASAVIEQLDRAHIAHESQAGGTRVLVPVDQVDRARLLLAKDGMPGGGSIGYEIFDRGDAMAASSFQQGIAQVRALEGELSRTLRGLAGVRAVRVHLVLPRREPFQRDRQDAQASVVLTMNGAQRLDREGVQAVLNLVSAAVPGLRPQNIAVVDSRGNVLSRAGEPTGPAAAAQGAEELRRTAELRIARQVEEMLERTLGSGRVRAEATLDMDFDQVRETQEKFDPDGQVVRSQQSSSDTSRNTEQAQTVSVSNNLPNADAGQNPAGSQQQRQEETTNYEIGKTTRTVVRDQPHVKRLSLAVLVDGVVERAADGTPTWRERNAEEMSRIAALVRSAAGFDERRGDKVEVVSMRFTAEDAGEVAPPKGWAGALMDRIDVQRAIELGVLGLLGLLALVLVLRPMALRLVKVAESPALTDARAAEAAIAAGTGVSTAVAGAARIGVAGIGVAGAGAAGAGTGAALVGPDGQPLLSGPGGEPDMIDVKRIEGQMRASSMRRLGELIVAHPEESVAILRGWIAQAAVQ